MTKIKIIILLLMASLFSFRQTAEIELKSDNNIKEDILVETVEEKANVEELPIIEDTFGFRGKILFFNVLIFVFFMTILL